MRKLNCVCLLDSDSTNKLKKLMVAVSDKCKSINALHFAPHLTLRNDFCIKENALEDMFLKTEKLVSSIKAFSFTTTKYGFYPWKIIYLDIKKSLLLQNLHEEIMEIVKQYRTEWVQPNLLKSKHFNKGQMEYIKKYGYQFAFEYFYPHFTIAGNDMSEDLFFKVKEELKNRSVQIDGIVEKVVFMDREKNNEVVGEFPLLKN